VSQPGPGRLVALEGVDGCGKSTQAALLANHLGAVLTREPGGTALGRSLRRLLLEPDGAPVAVRAEALLMAADRAQHLEELVEPALAAGRWVVTDRFTGSTLAYQGWGRGLDLDTLAQVVRFATGGRIADLTVLLDIAPEAARARLVGAPDRLEGLDHQFHRRVRAGYLHQAEADPTRWAVVDGTGAPEEVARVIAEVVADRLGPVPRAVAP
jgi:dTMP kinase